MMNRAWVALMVLACAGLSGGGDVRAAEGGEAVPHQVSAGAAGADQQAAEQEEAKGRGEQQEAEGTVAGKREGRAGHGKAGQPRAGHGKTGSGEAGGDMTLVDVNKASAEQLEALPGIGAAMASRIVDYRQKHGPFKRLDDLMNVRGIGEKNFLKLKPLITIGAGRPEPKGADPKGTDQTGTDQKGAKPPGTSESR